MWHDILDSDTYTDAKTAAFYGGKVGDLHWNGVARYLREFEQASGQQVTRIAGTGLGFLLR
jgi:hypothetical protein